VSKEEIQLYLDRARQDLQAVEINIQNDLYNVAISRAYYAMFYAATALLKSKGIERNKHSGIVAAFGEHFVKSGLFEAKFSRMLIRAFESRNDTDYDVRFVAGTELAKSRLQDAQEFVEQVETYLREGG
jgi:uncharacterized protein (UPF0332 family)